MPITQPDLVYCLAGIRQLFGAAACSCSLVDGEGGSLEFVAADGAGAAEIVGVQIPVGRGIAGWAATSGQPIAVRDVSVDPRFASDVAEATHYVPSVVLATPILTRDGEVVGVLEVLDPTADTSGDWALGVLGTLAAQLSVVIEGWQDQSSAVSRSEALLALLRDRGPAVETMVERVLEALADGNRGKQ